MIYKKQYGHPFDTESVVGSFVPAMETIPYLTREPDGFSYVMDPQDILYGLGENIRGINKRGWVYESKCSDDPNHTESKSSLYGAYNFMIVSGKATFGFFIDYPGKVTFDCGYTDLDTLRVTVAEENYDLYIIEGKSPTDIVQQFRQLVGRSYIPPKWAFGATQSRWSYMNEDEVREVVANYRTNNMPLDAVVLDIDYMERYKDFTVDEQRFPHFADFAAEMKAQGIRLVPIIDAGVKIEDGYDVYEEGVKNGYFCTNQDGTPFVAGVWPGRVHFPDMLNPEARAWFGSKYKFLLNQGIEGFWNDMNEPALFYSPERLKAFFESMDELSRKDNIVQDEFFGKVVGGALGLMNAPEDYASFYHDVNGQRVRHDRVHNLYGGNMTRAAGEAFARLRPGRRTLLYSRSSFIGSHRYGGIWLGDNASTWAQLLANIQMMPNVQLCGFLYTGADLCGFSYDTTPDLALRWLEFGLFTPLMRNHATDGSRMQEYYRFADMLPALRKMLRLRYALLPYLYSTFMKAALENTSYFRPLGFDFPADPDAREVQDQLLLGEGVMVAPVYTQNASGRHVYLPEAMKLYRIRSVDDYDTELLPAGHHYVRCALDEVLLFIRPGHAVPVARPASCTAQLDDTALTLWACPDENGSARCRMYTDDGETSDFAAPEHWKTVEA